MQNQPQQSEWQFAAELIYPAQLHDLALKSNELFTALAIVANLYTAPATLAELAGLWHASNQVCEAIAADTRTPADTLQIFTQFKYGKRARVAKGTLAKQVVEFMQSRAAAVLAAQGHAENAAIYARNAAQEAQAADKKGKNFHAQRAATYAAEAARIPAQIAACDYEKQVNELHELAKEKAEYALSAMRNCEKSIW